MKLHVINTGFFKLDGGAMFGVVPKSIWNHLNPSDENNLCSWALRCLLIEDGDHLILIDTGIGSKQSDKFFGYYYLHGDDSLEKSLRAVGFAKADVTDVFLTHLHFDHCGGAIEINKGKFVPAFPRARYWSNADHWQWAANPNPRERASFLKENIEPIAQSGQLQFIDLDKASPFPRMEILAVSGHTEKMMIPKIRWKEHTICFVTDLLPSAGHLPLPYVMAYDTRPLLTMSEKEDFLREAAEKNYTLFFEHDPAVECCTVQRTERGIRLKESFPLTALG